MVSAGSSVPRLVSSSQTKPQGRSGGSALVGGAPGQGLRLAGVVLVAYGAYAGGDVAAGSGQPVQHGAAVVAYAGGAFVVDDGAEVVHPAAQYGLSSWAALAVLTFRRATWLSALIALETNRDRSRVPVLLGALIDLLRRHDDEELTAAFTEWVEQVLVPRRFRGSVSGALPRLE